MTDTADPSDPQARTCDLTLVIPVYEDEAGLSRILDQVAGMDVFDAVVVVDDVSPRRVTKKTLGTVATTLGKRLTLCRQKQQGGAGAARNAGLARVRTSHVLFFDSDDWFLPEALSGLIAALRADPAAQAADFTLFRHCDSRSRARGTPGPLPSDQDIWDRVTGDLFADPDPSDPDTGASDTGTAPELATLPRDRWPDMVRIAAYPWNKIYRTDFLRAQAVRCTEIPVHNDIELHWAGFLAASQVRVSTAMACEHVVETGGTRLTNRRGADRLQVFAALQAVQDRLVRTPGKLDFLTAFAGFELDLFNWINGTLEDTLKPQFATALQGYLLARNADLFRLLALQDATLAQRVLGHLRRPV